MMLGILGNTQPMKGVEMIFKGAKFSLYTSSLSDYTVGQKQTLHDLKTARDIMDSEHEGQCK